MFSRRERPSGSVNVKVLTIFAFGPCISASIAAPLLIPIGSWYLPGRSLPRRIVTVALASNSRA